MMSVLYVVATKFCMIVAQSKYITIWYIMTVNHRGGKVMYNSQPTFAKCWKDWKVGVGTQELTSLVLQPRSLVWFFASVYSNIERINCHILPGFNQETLTDIHTCIRWWNGAHGLVWIFGVAFSAG